MLPTLRRGSDFALEVRCELGWGMLILYRAIRVYVYLFGHNWLFHCTMSA